MEDELLLLKRKLEAIDRELRSALSSREMPKPPNDEYDEDNDLYNPVCGYCGTKLPITEYNIPTGKLFDFNCVKFCPHCGQRIDWSEWK